MPYVIILLDILTVMLQHELGTSNSLMGYRAMWKCLRDKYHIVITRFGVDF